MNHSIFDYTNYKKYLTNRLPIKGFYRGARAKLAAALGCQGAFISQVLNGETHFSLEHAILIDEFFNHTKDESEFFMLLVHHGRAGSKKLKDHYAHSIENLIKKRKLISERIKVTEKISLENQVTYYGNWIYSAVHILLLIPELRNRQALSNHLQLPQAFIATTLDRLIEMGLVTESKGQYNPTTTRIHLSSNSPLLPKHHTNWRVRALTAIDQAHPENLHYSGPLALSLTNAEKIKKILLSTIEQMEPIIADTGEEEGYCLSIDYFKI